MRVRLINHIDQSARNAFVFGHPDGIAYHFFAWKKAVEQDSDPIGYIRWRAGRGLLRIHP